jgi:hypothetical protein
MARQRVEGTTPFMSNQRCWGHRVRYGDRDERCPSASALASGHCLAARTDVT